jgi:general transcription factor 3C polypeptide 5 (transcription factor C subunit 1)
MTVEHPCIVKNVDKAVDMIGGPSAITRSHTGGQETTLNLRFHPNDPTSRPVVSVHNRSNNILLQVTVPRRTGRKRKRGSDGPFLEDLNDPAPSKDSRYVLRSLQDNSNTYSVDPLATVSSSHVWRSIPDFVYSTAQSLFLKDIREKVLPMSYPLMKQYRLPQTYGLTNTEMIPPSQFSNKTIPTSYSYRSNALIQTHTDPVTGEQSLYQGKDRKTYNTGIQWYMPIPTTTSPLLPPLSTQDTKYQSIVTLLRDIFAKRPIWTKRGLINQLPSNVSLLSVRAALSHVAFSFRSGPWRDTVCAFGVDPRSDPKYRIYQSMMTLRRQGRTDDTIDDDDPWDGRRIWKRSEDPQSHIFSGQGKIHPDGKIWQVCDIVDPQLVSIINLDESEVEDVCEVRTRGFYPAGAWAKLKYALKYKVAAMQKGKVEEIREAIDRFLMLPNFWDGEVGDLEAVVGEVNGGYLPFEFDGVENTWAVLWRAACKKMRKDEEKAKGKGKRVRFSEDVEGMEDGESDMEDTPNAEHDDLDDEPSEPGSSPDAKHDETDEETKDGDVCMANDGSGANEKASEAAVLDDSQSGSEEPDAAVLPDADVPIDTDTSRRGGRRGRMIG